MAIPQPFRVNVVLDGDVLARLDSIEAKLDRILVLLRSPDAPEPGQTSGGLRDHEGQDAR